MLNYLKKMFEGRRAGSEQAEAGAEGERQAADFLRRERGFTILARNWRSPRDRREEIDLVCSDGGVLVFVEVKTRSAGALVSGYHAVDAKKKKILLRACRAYLKALGGGRKPHTLRFDIVEVSRAGVDGEGPVVRHFENVPLFPKELGAW